jgi:hypothetical protein
MIRTDIGSLAAVRILCEGAHKICPQESTLGVAISASVHTGYGERVK